MARKRKRGHKNSDCNEDRPSKRADVDGIKYGQDITNNPTLGLYYTRRLTLRAHLLAELPVHSKSRRRRVLGADLDILDKTLVCSNGGQKQASDSARLKDFQAFSQQINVTARSSTGGASSSQSDLIDFAIWFLFHRTHRHAHRPPHMLCHGYQRATGSNNSFEDHCALAGIPGIISHFPNYNVNVVKKADWTEVLDLLGKEGDRIMLDLVLQCDIFQLVNGGQGNFYQLSGRHCPYYAKEIYKHSHS